MSGKVGTEGEVTLKRASIDDKVILHNLMELCQHDYSEFNGEDVQTFHT